MTWKAFHNRGEILRTVVDFADQQRDGLLPMHLPGVTERFADELDLLSALQLKWHARLSGNIERELMSQPMDLESSVMRAWRATTDELPGVRRIIDHYTELPSNAEMAEAVAKARHKEWTRLAAAAGLSNDESRAAAAAGQKLEANARLTRTVARAATAFPQQTQRVLSPAVPAHTASTTTKPTEEPTVQTTQNIESVPETTTSEPTSERATTGPQVSFVDRIKAVLAA